MIEIDGVSRTFGAVQALRGVTFAVPQGEVCGLIGPNGAGKTTLLRILATVIPLTAGRVRIAGIDLRADVQAIRMRIGYMPDAFGAYEELRVDSYLEFFAHIYRLDRGSASCAIDDILRLVDLESLRNAPISRLSRGARQRLGLGRVLLHNPEVLLLDEPVSGLDPRARVEVRELLKELGRMGKTVLISSHVLTDLADLCHRVAIIEAGALVFTGTIDEIKRRVRAERRVEIAVEGDPEAAREFLKKRAWARDVTARDGGAIFVTIGDADLALAEIPAALIAAGFRLTRFIERDVDLEEAFLHLTKGEVT
ncbi:MAG: ABC transporter ATP-binding protein [Planctomycetes bacterium]|nr:ABC transporter ATP-binding protein [Planctomycetota bacterium]